MGGGVGFDKAACLDDDTYDMALRKTSFAAISTLHFERFTFQTTGDLLRGCKYKTCFFFKFCLTLNPPCVKERTCLLEANIDVFALWPVVFYKNVFVFSNKTYFGKAYLSWDIVFY